MRIGVPTEVKPGEGRVALTPGAVRDLVRSGAEVAVEAGAGRTSRFTDQQFKAAGADILASAGEVWEHAELVVKVKEPQPEEIARLRHDHVLFTYLHLAADPELTGALQGSGATAIAYETVTDPCGRLPLLTPMSEIAGRLATQFAAQHLLAHEGGRGLLPGSTPGVPAARVLIIGGGIVGENAARVALGLGCDTTVGDIDVGRLRDLAALYGPRLNTLVATQASIDEAVGGFDVVIGAVLTPGARAPLVLRSEHLMMLGEGAVVVDVSIDQGGCFETSRPTTHAQPTFVVDGVVHNCVANMPGAVPASSTHALVNATFPYVQRLAVGGMNAVTADPGFAAGVNVTDGRVVHPAVAAATPATVPVEVTHLRYH